MLALVTIGSSGMDAIAMVLSAVQAGFGVARSDASLPCTLLMVGFVVVGVVMGRPADRGVLAARAWASPMMPDRDLRLPQVLAEGEPIAPA